MLSNTSILDFVVFHEHFVIVCICVNMWMCLGDYLNWTQFTHTLALSISMNIVLLKQKTGLFWSINIEHTYKHARMIHLDLHLQLFDTITFHAAYSRIASFLRTIRLQPFSNTSKFNAFLYRFNTDVVKRDIPMNMSVAEMRKNVEYMLLKETERER